jgi:hypothetical protein
LVGAAPREVVRRQPIDDHSIALHVDCLALVQS